jgi:nucleoside-diphosphate-sugar epimerase
VNCLDISRAQKELDWKPIISLKEGIARSWEWLQHEEKDKMIVHTTC